ncbi:MAG: hypothetical protein KDD44_09320, partial [Bdellovibrionales bacterium]|nr:hypothetical protein [Bdellovibrionales bacterium]
YLESLNITPLLRRKGRELSKGQRRRVQMAAGFMIQPRLFAFDEPFDGLDILQSNQLAELLARESSQISILLSSHRMDVVERLADTIVVLFEGHIHCVGNLESVCRSLCRESILITHLGDSLDHSVLHVLRDEFPGALVNHFGTQYAVSGNTLDHLRIEETLARAGIRDFHLTRTTPSLVDAMNFHLKSSGIVWLEDAPRSTES